MPQVKTTFALIALLILTMFSGVAVAQDSTKQPVKPPEKKYLLDDDANELISLIEAGLKSLADLPTKPQSVRPIAARQKTHDIKAAGIVIRGKLDRFIISSRDLVDRATRALRDERRQLRDLGSAGTTDFNAGIKKERELLDVEEDIKVHQSINEINLSLGVKGLLYRTDLTEKMTLINERNYLYETRDFLKGLRDTIKAHNQWVHEVSDKVWPGGSL
ncbi:MAG TPA: hypothetical protein VFA15_02980 [Nitrososphaera sp.]|nr:hypothetical protein [Nitrososphaera sp.]